jgi:hypothetical protein
MKRNARDRPALTPTLSQREREREKFRSLSEEERKRGRKAGYPRPTKGIFVAMTV